MLSDSKNSPDKMLWPCLIIVFSILIYGHSLSNSFIWDDDTHVWKNLFVGSWSGLKNIWTPVRTLAYYPVTFTSFWVQHKLWTFIPSGYHIISLTFHILNALLFFELSKKLAPRIAGLAALLFAIHPIQVETVAWIAEQKNLLSLFFTLLAFLAFLDFDEKAQKKDYAKTLFFFTAALLSKTTAVCFAVVPFLYRWWKQKMIIRRDLLISLPFFIIGGMDAFINIYLENSYVGAQFVSPFSHLGLLQKIPAAGRIFFFYIQQTLLPWKFMTLYPRWDIASPSLIAWGYPIGALALYTVLFWKRHYLGRGAFALFCFYGFSIFPVLGFVNICFFAFSYAADHFSYFSAPPLFLLFCSGASVLSSKLHNSLVLEFHRLLYFLKKYTAITIAIYLSFLSFCLSLDYKDNLKLWGRLLQQNPGSFFVYHQLGILCFKNPHACTLDQGIHLFQKALRLEPTSWGSYEYLGRIYEKKGAYQQAVDAYRPASEFGTPFDRVNCYQAIAAIYLVQNKPAEAIPYLNNAIALQTNPEYQKQKLLHIRVPSKDAFPFLQLAHAYFLLKKNRESLKNFRRAAALDPENPRSYEGMGATYLNLGDAQNAADSFRQAHRLAPHDKSIKTNLDVAESQLRRSAEGFS